MSEQKFPEKTRIIASSSDYFPLEAAILVRPIQTNPNRVQVVKRKGEEPEEVLFEADLPPQLRGPDRALRGSFRNRETNKMLHGLVTLCPGRVNFLVGHITSPEDRIEEGGTGVWVAEERPEPEEPPGRK